MTAPAPRFKLLHLLCSAAFLTLSSLPAFAQPMAMAFTANESQVTPQADMIDPEFSQARARITWVDKVGSLWIASVDRATGLFVPSNGKGLRVDADAMTTADLKLIANGPEWLTSASTDQIVYTKFVPGQPRTMANARLAVAAQGAGGAWSSRLLSSKLPRNAPYASSDPGDTSPRISYIDDIGNHYWRDVNNPASETLVTWFPPTFYLSMRFVRGARATVFTAPDANGVAQVFRYGLDTQAMEQISFDGGHGDTRSAPWMWQAPEFGNEYVMAALVKSDKELRVYRQVDKTSPVWQVIYRATHPTGGSMNSMEPFTHNGKSYLFTAVKVPPHTFASAVYLSSIDAQKPVFRQLTPPATLRSRKDPEVFVTNAGPFIYFNRADPSLVHPGQLLENCLQCSEGVYRANTGLGPVLVP